MSEPKFKVGGKVNFKGFGKDLTVTSLPQVLHGVVKVECTWFNSTTTDLCQMFFPEELLEEANAKPVAVI